MAKPRPAPSPLAWTTFRSRVRRLPSADQGRIREAFDLGREAHGGQTRASGEPYFSHCIAVAGALADIGADADTIVAAFLHDAVEDTPLMLPEIERRFGAPVRALVEAATKLRSEDVAERPTLDEKIETLRKIFTFMREDVRIMALKLFDRLHNMQTAEFLPEGRRQAVAQESLDVYVKVAERLSMRDLRDELEELCLAVLNPGELGELLRIRAENERAGRVVIERMRRSLNASDPQHRHDVRVHYEPKAFPRLRAQRDAKGAATTGVSSVTAVFVCDTVAICYQVLGILHGHYLRETLSFQDFINAPQVNGCRGLHTTVILEDGTRVRCKIRTREMQEYARRGIATKCFDQEVKGLPDYLQWGERVAALTQDTAERSKEFFASLQSDILGEAIVIHLPDDRTVLLPRGATALDGAFYAFSDLALRLRTVLVNGKEAAFQMPLSNADSLTVELKRENAVRREWLLYAQTGLAKAKIRAALAKAPREQRIADGRALLQGVMTERRKGLIEEFREEGFLPGLKSLGLFSLEDACIAIAEGQVEPAAVATALFESPRRRAEANGRRRRYVLRFAVPSEDIEARQRLLRAYYKYDDSIRGVKNVHPPSSDLRSYRIVANLSPEECEEFRKEIEEAGGEGVLVTQRFARWRCVLGVGVLLFLWGIDPVIARLLIADYGVTPVDLTLIRFWMLTLLCGGLLGARVVRGELKRETSIPLRSPWLLFSAVLLVIVAWSTYAALQFTWPSHYTIPMTAAGIVLTTIQNAKRWPILLVTWVFFASGALLLVLDDPGWPIQGIFLTVLAVLSFTCFSIVSERYKRKEGVAERALQYFFVLSLICLLLSIPFISLNTIAAMPPHLILMSILFSIFIASLPYYLYYYALSHRQIDFVLRYSFLIIFASVGGQWLVWGEMSWLVGISAVLVVTGALLSLIYNAIRSEEVASMVHPANR